MTHPTNTTDVLYDESYLEIPSTICRIPPLRGIFFAEFDVHLGTVLSVSEPETLISKTKFDAIAPLIIPKNQVLNQLVKINLQDMKIMSYPIGLMHGKYERNAYYFNCCLCVDNISTLDSIYEPIVQKLAQTLKTLEMQHDYLSKRRERINDPASLRAVNASPQRKMKEQQQKISVQTTSSGGRKIKRDTDYRSHADYTDEQPEIELAVLLKSILSDINEKQQCQVRVSSLVTVHLRLNTDTAIASQQASSMLSHDKQIMSHSIPIFAKQSIATIFLTNDENHNIELAQFDVISLKVCACIDGRRTIGEIANATQIDVELVCRCIHHLLIKQLIILLPLICYTDTYAPTYKLRDLYDNPWMQNHCCRFVALRCANVEMPKFGQVFRLLCLLNPARTISEWCEYAQPRLSNVDEIRLLQFAVAHSLIRHVQDYPVYTGPDELNALDYNSRILALEADGTHTLCQLAVRTGQSVIELQSKIDPFYYDIMQEQTYKAKTNNLSHNFIMMRR